MYNGLNKQKSPIRKFRNRRLDLFIEKKLAISGKTEKQIGNVQFKFIQNIRTNKTFFQIGFIRFYMYLFCIRFESIIFD